MCLLVKKGLKFQPFTKNVWNTLALDIELVPILKHPTSLLSSCPPPPFPFIHEFHLAPQAEMRGGGKRRQGSIWRVFHTMLLVLFKLKIRLHNPKVIKNKPTFVLVVLATYVPERKIGGCRLKFYPGGGGDIHSIFQPIGERVTSNLTNKSARTMFQPEPPTGPAERILSVPGAVGGDGAVKMSSLWIHVLRCIGSAIKG